MMKRSARLWALLLLLLLLGRPTPGWTQRPAAATGARLGWEQSYKAGYRDRQGAWAGGSEIMHIKAHKGMLFAFNG